MKLKSLLNERVYAQLAKTSYQGDESTDPAPKILALGTYTSTRGNRCLAGITLKKVVELFGADGIKILQKFLPDILGYSDLTKKAPKSKRFENLATDGEELHPRPLKSTGGTVGRYDMGAHYVNDLTLNRIFGECYRTWIIGKMGKVSVSKMYTNDPDAQLKPTPETEQLQQFDELPAQQQLDKSLEDLSKASEQPESIEELDLPTTSLEKDQPSYPTIDKPLAGKPEAAQEPDLAPKVVDPKNPPPQPKGMVDISDNEEDVKELHKGEDATDTFIKPTQQEILAPRQKPQASINKPVVSQKPSSTKPPSSEPEEEAIANIAKAKVNAAQDVAQKSPMKRLNFEKPVKPKNKQLNIDDLI